MDSITAKWFDDASVVVERAPEYANFMSDPQIARITGAPRNSTVSIYSDDDVVAFKIENEIFDEPMYRYLVQNPDGDYSFYLKNAVLVLAEKYANEGIGARTVIREIYEATRWAKDGVVVTHIEVSAVGNYDSFRLSDFPLRGYYVWATMGFDGEIPNKTLMKLGPDYKNYSKISELAGTHYGLNLWKIHGESVDLRFDLRVGSPSWQQLRRYMKDKGIVL
jgi:hypothetical protein